MCVPAQAVHPAIGEEKLEGGGRRRVRGDGRVRGVRTRTREQVHFSVLFHCINIFLRLSFSNSHISSTSSPPTIVQTGDSDPLNAFI